MATPASKRSRKKFWRRERTSEDGQLFYGAEAPEGLQGWRGLFGGGLARRPGGLDWIPSLRCAALGSAHFYPDRLSRFSDRGRTIVGLRHHARRREARCRHRGRQGFVRGRGVADRAGTGLVFLRPAFVSKRRC